MAARGYNTVYGQDTGAPPPGIAPGFAPTSYHMHPQQPYYSQAVPGPTMPPTQPWQMYQNTPFANFTSHYGIPGHQYQGPGMHPHMAPTPINNEIPGLHFRNPSGGIGLPPGYDYLFPAAHTVIHVFKLSATSVPPWQSMCSPYDLDKFIKFFVPTQLTVLELMGRLGLNNGDAKKNVVHEVVEKGSGGWAKGMTIRGDDKDRTKKKLAEMGWDQSRIGVPGKRPVVWLWISKK